MAKTKKNEENLDTQKQEAIKAMEALNTNLRKLGMLEMALVSPQDCLPQRVNARYFTVDKMEQLTANVKATGALESVPLVFQYDKLAEQGKYEIVSGHHRIEAAKAAGLEIILVMVHRDITKDQLTSKQLSHNALVGQDDKGILKQLFDSIQDIDQRMATGLQDEIDKVKYDSLNFKIGTFRTFIIAFAPNDIEDYDKAAKEFFDLNVIPGDAEIRIAASETYDKFIEAIMKVKKMENIKSNAVALHRIITIACEVLKKGEEAQEMYKAGSEGLN